MFDRLNWLNKHASICRRARQIGSEFTLEKNRKTLGKETRRIGRKVTQGVFAAPKVAIINSFGSMTHPSQLKNVGNIRHITYPLAALRIAKRKTFYSQNNRGSYDGGANFIGVLGETENTHPKGRGAILVCCWIGQVSDPLPHDAYKCDVPDTLYDFNGSGLHFKNNDPRYFLPFDSKDLILCCVEFDDDQALLKGWSYMRGGIYAFLYEKELFHKYLLRKAVSEIGQLNAECKKGEIKLSVRRGGV